MNLLRNFEIKMISKIFYMNDEPKDMVVRILDEKYDPVTCQGDTYVTLQPCESRVFEVHMPADHILYVKRWDYMVLISSISLSSLQDLESNVS